MRRLTLSFVAALVAVVVLSVVVSGQNGGVGLFEPFAIHVTHEEPITVVATTTTAAGEVVTVTTPITIGVDLRIDVKGPGLASVDSSGPTASNVEVVVAEPVKAPAGTDGFVDSSGRVYAVDAPVGIVIGQVQSKENLIGSEFFGRITNETDEPLEFVFVTVQVLDADGTLLSVDTGAASLSEIAPGQTSPFQVLGQTPYDDVHSYIVQVKP